MDKYSIKFQDGKWLANQQTAAKFLDISITAFQRREYEPYSKEGNQVFYNVKSLLTGSDDDLDANAELARLRKEQADKTELENGKLRGELIEVDEVQAAWDYVASVIVQSVMSLPKELAPHLVDKDEDEIESEIESACREALAEITETRH